MKFSTLAGLALVATSATAAPTLDQLLESSDLYARGSETYGVAKCLDSARAQQVATNFKNLIVTYSDTLANATLTVDFTDYSDSVNELIDSGCPGPVALGSATFSSRAEFEKGQGGQPSIPFEQLNIWNTCSQVVLRWRSKQTPNIVTGIIVLETVPAPQGSKYSDLIKKVYSEFNSGAWLVNLGVFKPKCT